MKAYRLWIKDEEDYGIETVFANTAKEAKKQVGELMVYLDNYTDLRVKRMPEYDDMENLSEVELQLKQWRNGWLWLDLKTPDPDETTDKEFLDWWNDKFNNQESR